MFLPCAWKKKKKKKKKSPELCIWSPNALAHIMISATVGVWSVAQIQGFSTPPHTFFSFFSNWYVTNDEICYWGFHVSLCLLSGPAILQAINKNATFICISNWGESIKIKDFHLCLSINHSLCAPKTARRTSHCLSSRMISWKGRKNNLLLAHPQHV